MQDTFFDFVFTSEILYYVYIERGATYRLPTYPSNTFLQRRPPLYKGGTNKLNRTPNTQTKTSSYSSQLSKRLEEEEMGWTRGQTIGRGSTATVSLATTQSGDLFAVKSTELQNSEFLRREQNFLSALSNPHLVTYNGCDITRENNKLMYNLFLEYVPGGTLNDAIRVRGGPLDEPSVRRYTCQILKGLEHIHSNGIAHCDIKGQNILIGQNGAKIADFGCAKWTNGAVSGGPIGGTPLFMAPEVTRGENQGYPADIWALGCTVIEMATGNSPWPYVNDPLSILYTIAFSGKIPEIPDFFSSQARDFLGKCLIRDPKERWTAKELLKHPFVEEFNCQTKKFEDFDTSFSPTSILDQGIWNSVYETESMVVVGQSGPLDCPARRIGRLGLDSGVPRWGLDDEESWITIRCNDRETCGSVTDMMDLIHFSDKKVGCSFSSSDFLMGSVESGFVISNLNFDRHEQLLLFNKSQFL